MIEHPAYVVNLDSRPARLEAFRASLAAAGNPFAVERWPARDGRRVEPPKQPFAGTAGAWGCLLSHQSLYQHAIAEGLAGLIIFEDDAQFVPNFARRFAAFMADVPDDWQLLYLGGNHHFYGAEWPTPVTPRVARCARTFTTHAYAIRAQAMRYVLSLPPSEPIDLLLCRAQRQFPAYCATPDLVLQAAGPSDIGGGGQAIDYSHIWRTQAEMLG